jgi:hypothetical protein
MPFPKQTSRPYTKADVESLPTGRDGCYGIFKKDVWIYVGKGDIRTRLLAHLNGDTPCIARWNPTHYVIEVTAGMDGREKTLIRELNPECNKRVG